MKKTFTSLAILAHLTLTACTGERSREVKFNAIPAELSDCKFFELKNAGADKGVVTRCPNSSTAIAATHGKAVVNSVTVDATPDKPIEQFSVPTVIMPIGVAAQTQASNPFTDKKAESQPHYVSSY